MFHSANKVWRLSGGTEDNDLWALTGTNTLVTAGASPSTSSTVWYEQAIAEGAREPHHHGRLRPDHGQGDVGDEVIGKPPAG